jgi:hypothetical protein
MLWRYLIDPMGWYPLDKGSSQILFFPSITVAAAACEKVIEGTPRMSSFELAFNFLLLGLAVPEVLSGLARRHAGPNSRQLARTG